MRPKFAVGEVVILQSVNFPECNGEYTVVSLRVGKWPSEGESPYSYLLDIDHNVEGWGDHWREDSLRKKHTPGEMNFTDLMHSLSSPKLITHQT